MKLIPLLAAARRTRRLHYLEKRAVLFPSWRGQTLAGAKSGGREAGGTRDAAAASRAWQGWAAVSLPTAEASACFLRAFSIVHHCASSPSFTAGGAGRGSGAATACGAWRMPPWLSLPTPLSLLGGDAVLCCSLLCPALPASLSAFKPGRGTGRWKNTAYYIAKTGRCLFRTFAGCAGGAVG